jgi:hypothetical protein
VSGVGVLIWVAQWAGANAHDPEGMSTGMTIIDAWLFSVTGAVLLLTSLLTRLPSPAGRRRARVLSVLRAVAIVLVVVALIAMIVSPGLVGGSGPDASDVLVAAVGALFAACVIGCALPFPPSGARARQRP